MQNVHEVIDRDGKALRSPDLFHPGCILKEEIEAREITKKDFAELLNILPTHLSEVFAGKRPVGPKMARRLEGALDISAGFWLRMQADYDLKLAEQEADPVLDRIEHIVAIQQRSNTTLSKALVAYEVAHAEATGTWVSTSNTTTFKRRNVPVTAKNSKFVVKKTQAKKTR
jgi:addiction module HigA family antidote